MKTKTPTPAPDWYADPSGLHEFRYWDGTRWTEDIADAGVRGHDATPPPPPSAADLGAGYPAVAVAKWRVVLVLLSGFGLFLVLMFEAFTSMAARGSTTSSILTNPEWAYWLYKPLDASTADASGSTMVAYYGFPPLALWFGLIAASVLMLRTQVDCYRALKKAGRRFGRKSSVRDERDRLGAALANRGCARRFVFRLHQRALLLGSAIASLVVVLVSGYALVERSGVMLGHGEVVSDLSVGIGPRLCLAAGIFGVLAVVAAWPWRPERRIVVHSNGSVSDADAQRDDRKTGSVQAG